MTECYHSVAAIAARPRSERNRGAGRAFPRERVTLRSNLVPRRDDALVRLLPVAAVAVRHRGRVRDGARLRRRRRAAFVRAAAAAVGLVNHGGGGRGVARLAVRDGERVDVELPVGRDLELGRVEVKRVEELRLSCNIM